MVEFEAKLRKVGDSVGILIPHQVLVQMNRKPGQTIQVVIPERVDWSGIWGKFRSRTDTDALIARARTERD